MAEYLKIIIKKNILKQQEKRLGLYAFFLFIFIFLYFGFFSKEELVRFLFVLVFNIFFAYSPLYCDLISKSFYSVDKGEESVLRMQGRGEDLISGTEKDRQVASFSNPGYHDFDNTENKSNELSSKITSEQKERIDNAAQNLCVGSTVLAFTYMGKIKEALAVGAGALAHQTYKEDESIKNNQKLQKEIDWVYDKLEAQGKLISDLNKRVEKLELRDKGKEEEKKNE